MYIVSHLDLIIQSRHRLKTYAVLMLAGVSRRNGDALSLRASIAEGVAPEPIAESLSESSSIRLPASTSDPAFSFSRRTSRPRLWQYQSTNRSTSGRTC